MSYFLKDVDIEKLLVSTRKNKDFENQNKISIWDKVSADIKKNLIADLSTRKNF